MTIDRPEHPAAIEGGGANISRWSLFSGFALVGMFGFGGIAAALFHVVVERRRWLTTEEYTSTLGLGQVLPGANLINMSTMIGDRFQGFPGVLLALAGLMLGPLVCLVALAAAYDRFADLPDVRAATLAAEAAAVGLTVGTALKLGRVILKSPIAIAVALASFIAIGVLRVPMTIAIAILAPIAIAAGFWGERR